MIWVEKDVYWLVILPDHGNPGSAGAGRGSRERSARGGADGVRRRDLRPQPETGRDPVRVAVVGGQVVQRDDIGVGQSHSPQRIDVVFADGARAAGEDRGVPHDLVEPGASRPAGQGIGGQPGDELAGYPLELELVAGARSAVWRLVEHRRHVYDGVLLGVGQARLQLVDDLVQPQPLVDEFGMEAAKLGVLGRLTEALGLPVVSLLPRPVRVLRRHCRHPCLRSPGFSHLPSPASRSSSVATYALSSIDYNIDRNYRRSYACAGQERVNAVTAAGTPGRRDVTEDEQDVALRFAGVSKRFDDGTLALLPFSFSALRGELVAIVGPSGCGKSTLLRLAAGLTAASTGTIAVGARNVGYVFQDPTLLPWRSVRRNVELLGELHGVPKPERRAMAEAAIAAVGLTGFEDKYPRALSGGVQMRASLARALTMSPDVFLFDEPFGAVDEITRERLNDELLRLFQARRFAALFVTHSVTDAAFLATRVLVISDRPGRILTDLEVPFPYPRRPELRYDPAFARVTGRIGAALRAEPGGVPQ